MKRFPITLAVCAVALAVAAAFLHPFALLLSFAPFDTRALVAFLRELRSLIADLLGWGVLALLLGMIGYIAWTRLTGKHSISTLASSLRTAADPLPIRGEDPGVAVAITAYNDAEATAQAVRDYRCQPGVVEVLVIDNNSTDKTAELAAAAGALVIREDRQGYGYTCIRGLTEALKVARADVVVLTEGDGTFVAEDTAKFLTYLDHADMVVGNRVVRGMVAPDSQMDHFFTWGNMAVAMLLRLRFWDGLYLGPAGLSDVGCTFRAIRRHALERILPDLTVGENHFSPHMLLVAFAHGISVVEIPIRFRRRIGRSKGASQSLWKGLQVGMAMIWHILTFTPASPRPRPGVVVERNAIIRRRKEVGSDSGQVEFVPGAAADLAFLSRRGHSVVVVGDRSQRDFAGVPRKLARAIDLRIVAEVAHRGGRIDAFVVCSHKPDVQCSCRHPEPGLLFRAARQAPLDFATAVVVSDRPDFLAAAARLGCRTILVGDDSNGLFGNDSPARANDLGDAVKMVLGAVRTDSSSTLTAGLQAIS